MGVLLRQDDEVANYLLPEHVPGRIPSIAPASSANGYRPKRGSWPEMFSVTPFFEFVLLTVGIDSLALLLTAVLLDR